MSRSDAVPIATPLEVCEAYITDQDKIAHAQALLANEELMFKATQILSALSDTTRFKILVALSADDLCVCDLQEICGVSQSAISHQLRLLRDRDLVTNRRDGQRAIYSIADEHVKRLIAEALVHAGHKPQGV